MSPPTGVLCLWAVWFVSWIAASAWSRATVAAPPRGAQQLQSVIIYVGFALLTLPTFHLSLGPRLWRLPQGLNWGLVGVAASGFVLAWWARIHLGRDWSWLVTRKQDHRLVDTGPYALVRHPIYTGLIIAASATAIVEAKAPSEIGLVLFVAGLWMKARLEERFLSAELGDAAYDEYVRRTGMILPGL
ncbi:MAG TPA: isoprenylcysteine carboxylmethyltransferase family protein [Caulobacteraceae bacterium]|nr:isoprenylcysteine carboxylmethyltransferase family protein [Caulobacteraceae bacterium]